MIVSFCYGVNNGKFLCWRCDVVLVLQCRELGVIRKVAVSESVTILAPAVLGPFSD